MNYPSTQVNRSQYIKFTYSLEMLTSGKVKYDNENRILFKSYKTVAGAKVRLVQPIPQNYKDLYQYPIELCINVPCTFSLYPIC